MEGQIYKKTFIKKSEEAVTKLDDHLGFVEEEIHTLHVLLRQLTKGNTSTLSEKSKTTVSSYEDRLARMQRNLTDMYTYKNDILEDLEKLREE